MRDPLVSAVYQPPSPLASNRGYSGPLQQWYESNFDPTSGYTNRVEYRGLDWTSSQTLANYFTNLGISANLKNEHGQTTLTLTDATGNYVIDRWEMSVDKETVSIFENPLFLGLIDSAANPAKVVSLMRNALQNSNTDADGTPNAGWDLLTQLMQPNPNNDPVTGLPTSYGAAKLNQTAVKFINFALGLTWCGTAPGNDGTTGATLAWTSANMVKLKQYFDAYNLGATDFLRGKYRLRHTANIPARWNVSVADFNVERIYTIPQLIAECTGSGFIYPLPNYLSYKILNYVPDPVSAQTPWYVFGALKEKSDAVTAVNNRVEIVTEYLIDNISTLVYSPI